MSQYGKGPAGSPGTDVCLDDKHHANNARAQFPLLFLREVNS